VSAAKKRKRESEVPVDSSAATGKDDDERSATDQQNHKTVMPTESSKKKPGRPKSSGKKAVVESTETVAPKTSEATKKVVKSGETKAKKQKLEKAPTASTLEKTSKVIKTPVPVPSVASAMPSEPKQTPVPLPQRTPVPLPQKSPRALNNSATESSAKKTKAVSPQSEVLVAETPPSQMSRTPATTPRVSAIPFSLSKASSAAVSTTKKAPGVDDSLPDIPLMVAAKVAKTDKHVMGSQGSVNPLTSSQVEGFTSMNLMHFKQPLNDLPKPRPRGRCAVSEATSTTSSSSCSTTRSIRDMFLRPNKPYTRPGEELSPLNNNKKKHAEKHNEANLATFTTTFTASQHTVNFTDEAEYLEEYEEWLSDSEAAGPLPCLHKATGCSPKSEQLLHLQRTTCTSTPALKVILTNESEAERASAAITRVQTASTFLRHSILTRVPIPLGPISGSWTLYCPKYTASHIDKYGFRQRNLRIYSITGLSSTSNAYTARLSIPPRSMSYVIQAFEAPPHASFRTTVFKTVPEGYKLHVMFLGNGYLKLRVDLQLLLMGKSAAESKAGTLGKQGKSRAEEGVWEFLGVHEKAVVWEPVVDELEKEGRKLLARYDGR
jgi:hypothetical protein